MLGFGQMLLHPHASAATPLTLEARLRVSVPWASESTVREAYLAAVILVYGFTSMSLSPRGSVEFALCFVYSALVLCGGSSVSHRLQTGRLRHFRLAGGGLRLVRLFLVR